MGVILFVWVIFLIETFKEIIELVLNFFRKKMINFESKKNTIKQTKQRTISNQNDNSPQLCPDGTVPPCKTPATQIKSPAKKTMFLSGFQSYDDGGEVVISSNVDKSLL